MYLRQLKQQLKIKWSQLPRIAIWNDEDIFDQNVANGQLYSRMFAKLVYLQNNLLIERFLSKHSHTNGKELLDVSRELLSITLNLYKHQDRFDAMVSIYEWIVSC
jgi:hypothetical protein